MQRLKPEGAIRRAVILVAGMGTRLGAMTRESPKCLVEVNGVPILANALDRLAESGIAATTLVVGHCHDAIRARIGNRWRSMPISYLTNNEYRVTSTSRSLWLALHDVDTEMLLLEGDVFFAASALDELLASPAPDVTLVERWRPALDGSVVQLKPDGSVAAWVHKKDRPAGFALDDTYKTVNMHRFSAAFVRDWLRPALASQLAADGGREPIETVFAAIIRQGGRIHAAEISGGWVEIDDEHDLRIAEATFDGATHEPR